MDGFSSQKIRDQRAFESAGYSSPAFRRKAPQNCKRLLWLSLAILAAFIFRPFYQKGAESKKKACDNSLVSDEGLSGDTPYSNNGRTDQVAWDGYSLLIRGQRVFIHSGEFHPFRLPVPSLWPDILHKAKAAGLNAISIYLHMGLINPSAGVINLDGFRALKLLYDAAKDVGLFVVVRPGPYINAETSAGGIPHWITSEVTGRLRSNATDFFESWQAYVKAIIEVTAPYQITKGGPVIAIQIDNEVGTNNPELSEYFAQLEKVYHDSNIVVPLTYNDPSPRKNFINGTGAVDLYGMDAYPQGFDCSNPNVWKAVTTDYYQYHQEVNPSQPWYTPEFQCGAYDAWGPTAPGYGSCRQLTGPDFQSVFNLQLWASNFKLINYYMFYGGTSWGHIPFHGVYTSYDYGAPISENRELTSKYTELKRQGLFLRSSPEFYKTDWVGNSSTGYPASNNDAFVTFLQNPDTNTSFYVIRQTDSTSTAIIDFRLNVSTSIGSLIVPQGVPSVTLSGRQSKLVITDYSFGWRSKLLYTTAQVLYAGRIGERDVLFLYGDASQQHEASLALTGRPNPQLAAFSNNRLAMKTIGKDQTLVGFLKGIQGLITVWDSSTQLILFSDTETAGTYYSPTIPHPHPSSDRDLANYWQFGTNNSILVGGPYLVREASFNGNELALRGDLREDVMLSVVAPPQVRRISWNGVSISPDLEASGLLSFVGAFVSPLSTSVNLGTESLELPVLENWMYADSLPEIQLGYDDSSWMVADRRTTNIEAKPYYGDGRILYGCDYGFCEGFVLWRGHFTASGEEKFVDLVINGGEAFAASVWLNGVFLKTTYGNSTNNRNIIEETDERFAFPPGVLISGRDNVITVLHDNMGLNESDPNPEVLRSPRGIRGFALDGGTTFGEWKVQGKKGGYSSFPDKHRGILNEGGLFGEREGWHLPSFPLTSSLFEKRDLEKGLSEGKAGVGFFVSTFELVLGGEKERMISFEFDFPERGETFDAASPFRAILFVNGWMMGKCVGNLGPQFKFPVHEGILDYHGLNTVAVALYVMEPGKGTGLSLKMMLDGVYEGGIGNIKVDNPAWTSVGRE